MAEPDINKLHYEGGKMKKKLEEIYRHSPYDCSHEEKKELVLSCYRELTTYHYHNCEPYRNIVQLYGCIEKGQKETTQLFDIPFIPIRLFKEYDLYSVPKDNIKRTVLSSGTTGQEVSRVYLDKETAVWQQKVLVKIVSDFIGKQRMPMLVIDTPDVLKDRTKFTTRGAGILGFSAFGAKQHYALNTDMSLNKEVIYKFLEQYAGKRVFLFGFTFMIWKHFLLELEKSKEKYDFSHAVLIHGGGWKKLDSEAVSKEEFKERLKKACGLSDIHENYGMAEQAGSLFMECACGHLHTSNFSEIFVRNPVTMHPQPIGKAGILQLMSVLPWSYPGYSLLTEDEAVILGEDDCPCGRKGKYFKVLGRLKNAELRGCSDTYAAGLSK